MRKKVIILIILLSLSCFGSEAVSSFEVHEWGVFVSGYNCDNTSVLTESPPVGFAFKPLLYFHSLENETQLHIQIKNITNVTTKPNATIDENSFYWNLTFIDNWIQSMAPDDYAYGPYQYYKHLFYEGEIEHTPNLIANVSTDGNNVTFYIKNQENYTLSDIYFIYANYLHSDISKYHGLTYITIETLNPGEEKTLITPLKEGRTWSTTELRQSLIDEGLTEDEADELVDYWKYFWFGEGNIDPPFAQIFYRLPEKIYDYILPIEINPEPENITRVGIYTVTEIPVPDFIRNLTYGKSSYERSYIFEGAIVIISIIIISILYVLLNRLNTNQIKRWISTFYFGLGSIGVFISLNALSYALHYETWENDLLNVIYIMFLLVGSIILLFSFYGFYSNRYFFRFTGVIGCILLVPYMFGEILDEFPWIYDIVAEITLLVASFIVIILTGILWKKLKS